jgi:alcohol dehydrogenase class IV
MEINLRALRQRAPENLALRRYDMIARILTGRDNAIANDGVQWVRDLCSDLEIPSLRAYHVTAQDLPVLVKNGAGASSMKGNPIALTTEELEEILTKAL